MSENKTYSDMDVELDNITYHILLQRAEREGVTVDELIEDILRDFLKLHTGVK
jgi:hypothetical protein